MCLPGARKITMKTYLFADMEFSGLDIELHRPLEIAMIATDKAFKSIKTYSSTFYWEEIQFNEWSEEQHASSGLLDDICDGRDAADIDADLLRFCSGLSGDLVLAGQSVHVDRSWIARYLPQFAKKLNHRVFDLTTIDMMLEDRGSSIRNRSKVHRAMADVRAAVKSAQHYAASISYSASLNGVNIESRDSL